MSESDDVKRTEICGRTSRENKPEVKWRRRMNVQTGKGESELAKDSATEPLGGQPPKGATSSVKDFDYQIKYQRAFEAVLWNMPAVAIYAFRRAAFDDLGAKDNDIIAYSAPATPKLEALTANSTTPYIAAYTDLQKGPVVLEIPVAGPDGSLYGQVVDAWQYTIADVGPSGLDKGKGGKYLFTPPDYNGALPQGYIQIASPNYRIAFAFRSVPAPGKSAADAYRYAQRLRMYYLSEVDNPPKQRFIDPINDRYATLPHYDERHFQDMHAIMSVEPVKEQDKVMMGMLKSLGIEKGKSFTPDETAKRAMRQAAIDAWYYLQSWFDNFPPELLYWPDRYYASLLIPDANRTFTFTYDDRIDLILRAAMYFWATYVPKVLSDTPATQYRGNGRQRWEASGSRKAVQGRCADQHACKAILGFDCLRSRHVLVHLQQLQPDDAVVVRHRQDEEKRGRRRDTLCWSECSRRP
jgi:hypothetical protein